MLHTSGLSSPIDKVDKRGRKVGQTSSEDLRKYYELEDVPDVGKERDKERIKNIEDDLVGDQDDGVESDIDHNDTNQSETDRSETETSSSDSEDEADGLESASGGAMEEWSEEVANVPLSDATSHRLALCNMNWDYMAAKDIFSKLEEEESC